MTNVYQLPSSNQSSIKEIIEKLKHKQYMEKLIIALYIENKAKHYRTLFANEQKCPLCGLPAKVSNLGASSHYKCNVCREFKVLNNAKEVIENEIDDQLLQHLSNKSQELTDKEILVLSNQQSENDVGSVTKTYF